MPREPGLQLLSSNAFFHHRTFRRTVRRKVEEYIKEKSAGRYAHHESRVRWFRDQFPTIASGDNEAAGLHPSPLTDLQLEAKARQAAKIEEVRRALIVAGYRTTAEQAFVLGVNRSTAWALLNRARRAGPSAVVLKRILSSQNLPQDSATKGRRISSRRRALAGTHMTRAGCGGFAINFPLSPLATISCGPTPIGLEDQRSERDFDQQRSCPMEGRFFVFGATAGRSRGALAERVGFEPTVDLRPRKFSRLAALNHSATSPIRSKVGSPLARGPFRTGKNALHFRELRLTFAIFKTGALNHSATLPSPCLVFGCYRICSPIGYAVPVAPLSMAWASLRSMQPRIDTGKGFGGRGG